MMIYCTISKTIQYQWYWIISTLTASVLTILTILIGYRTPIAHCRLHLVLERSDTQLAQQHSARGSDPLTSLSAEGRGKRWLSGTISVAKIEVVLFWLVSSKWTIPSKCYQDLPSILYPIPICWNPQIHQNPFFLFVHSSSTPQSSSDSGHLPFSYQ